MSQMLPRSPLCSAPLLLLLALASCGDIRVVPLDTPPDDAQNDSLQDVGQPLAVTIESPANGATVNWGENIHFSARVSGGNEPLDQLTATWTTADKKVLAAGPLDAQGRSAFDKADLPAGPQSIHIEVTGGSGAQAGRDLGLLINTPPTAPGVSIKPDKPTTLDNLVPVVTKEPSDVDRAPNKLTKRFEWHKSGDATVHPGGVNGELPAGTHKRGETWIVTAIANDGTADSPAATAQVVIADAPPFVPSLQISPATVDLLTVVTCDLATPVSDADGDAVTLVYGWRVGDYVNPGATTQTINVNLLESDGKHASLVAGASLYCTAIASDDQLSAPLATSPTVTVQVYDACKLNNLCDKNATCANSKTIEPICTCKSGFLTVDGGGCIDINECAAGYCSKATNCNNTPGGFQCPCKPGYTGNGVMDCTDIDECQNPKACISNATCTNTDGGFTCTCSKGFAGDPNAKCTDIDECQLTPSVCDLNAKCKNTIGSFACVCVPGYVSDGSVCVDVDECLTTTTGCSPDSTCKNTPGGFTCKCLPGFHDGSSSPGQTCIQTNECDPSSFLPPLYLPPCVANATCTDKPGSYTCACDSGYSGDGNTGGAGCADVDECATGTSGCSPNATCINTVGSATCVCKAGFTGDGKTCNDVDECSNGSANCSANATCLNAPGSVTCTCKSGFYGDGIFCAGDNLCTLTSCSEHATCTTVKLKDIDCQTVTGSQDASKGLQAECTCGTGWAGCGTIELGCINFNECLTDNGGCDPVTTCTDTSPGRICGDCPAVGYTGTGETGCFDINECLTNNGGCDVLTTCSNSVGGFTCGACPSGYTGTGATGCTNLDECTQTMPPCDLNAVCLDSVGSFSCTCASGFVGDATAGGTGCSDVNECAMGTAGCATAATCANTQGGYTCACNPGFNDVNGDGKTCTDIDECSNGSANCSANATCLNTPGSFTCTCKSGYSGDGVTCADIDECPPVEWSFDFSTAGVAGWTLDPPNLYAASNPVSSGVPPDVQWQLWSGALYYGNPAAGNYDTSAGGDTWANKGNATGPAVTLSANPWHQFGFDALINTETATTSDKFVVQLVIDSGTTQQVVTVWDKSMQTAPMGVNKHYTVYLNGYGGKTVRVRFSFDTGDGGKNKTLGVEVGKLSIRGAGSSCNPYATCVNTPGSFKCTCNAPYAGDGIAACNVLGTQVQPALSCKSIYDLNGFLTDGYYWLKWTTAPAAQFHCDVQGSTLIVSDNFETNAGAWTPKTLSKCGGNGELGGPGVAGQNYAMSTSLSGLPAHTQMHVLGTVQCIDAWSGQSVQLQVDDQKPWTDTVTNPLVGATPDSCGSPLWADLKRSVDATFPHAADSALVQFTTTLTSDPSIASYGIDQVLIWVK